MNKLRQSQPLIFKHTASINANVSRLGSIIDWNKQQFTKSIEDYKFMVRKEIKQEQVKEVLENLYRDKFVGKKVCIDRT